jgi:hypothetical protein
MQERRIKWKMKKKNVKKCKACSLYTKIIIPCNVDSN